MHNHQSTLDCQDCGRILKHLSPFEALKVADDPYNYVLFCPPCREDNRGLDDGPSI